MDNLTHSLFALTLVNAGFRRVGRGVTPALLVASNIPDIEVVKAFTGGRLAYLEAHRGPMHGTGGLLLAAGTAAAVWMWQRHRAARRPASASPARDASFLALLVAACVGVLGHIAMDLATSYGTRVLSPFSAAWFGVDWMPILDLFLLIVLSAGLLVAELRPAWRTGAALSVLLLTAGDYAFHAAAHSSAMTRALELEAALAGTPVRTDRPSSMFWYLGPDRPAALPAALPTLASPFRWRLVVPAPAGYVVTEVNLLDRKGAWKDGARARAVWFPNDAGPFVERASEAAMAQLFLTFSRFPSVEILTHANGDLTVHWYDLRFAQRRVPVGHDRRQHTSPFGAWVRLSPSGTLVSQGWGPG